MRTLAASERRTITIAAGVALLGLGYAKGLKPYFAALTEARNELAVARAALASERSTVATSTHDPALMVAVDSAMRAMQTRLFIGRDDVAMSAELSSYIAELAGDNHVLIQNSTTRAAVISPTGVRTLRVELRAESDLRGTLEWLEAIARGDRLVRVERLEITRPIAGDETAAFETLALSAVFNGFAIGDPPPAGRGASGGRGGRGGSTPIPATPAGRGAPSAGGTQ
jgi:hypothetical protein